MTIYTDLSKIPLKEAFIISDIHGCYDEFEGLLEKWNSNKQVLILNGDYIDRGPESRLVLKRIKELLSEYDGRVYFNWGNHEEFFMLFLSSPSEYWRMYAEVGGIETVQSLLGDDTITIDTDPLRIREAIIMRYLTDISFFTEKMAHIIDFGDITCVHAGVDFSKQDWRDTDTDTILWKRKFYYEHNPTDRTFVIGHTPTNNMNPGRHNFSVYQNETERIICIDGGVCFGGQLNGIVINRHGEILKKYSTRKLTEVM